MVRFSYCDGASHEVQATSPCVWLTTRVDHTRSKTDFPTDIPQDLILIGHLPPRTAMQNLVHFNHLLHLPCLATQATVMCLRVAANFTQPQRHFARTQTAFGGLRNWMITAPRSGRPTLLRLTRRRSADCRRRSIFADCHGGGWLGPSVSVCLRSWVVGCDGGCGSHTVHRWLPSPAKCFP